MAVATETLTSNPTTTTNTAHPVRRATVRSGVAAAALTTAAAGIAHAAGVSFHVDGEMIPLMGFAQMVLLGAILGGLILAGLNRRSSRAHDRFVQVTVALTALSCLPSVALPDDVGSKLSLVALHVLAAAIVIPALARQARS